MRNVFVVDTSVFVRWFLDQVGFEHAREIRTHFLLGAVQLETVDSVRFEFGHVLRTRGLLKGRLDGKEYVAATRAIDDLGVVHATDAAHSKVPRIWLGGEVCGSSTRCWCTARSRGGPVTHH